MKSEYTAVLQSVLELMFGSCEFFSASSHLTRIGFEPIFIGSNILSPKAHIAKLVRAFHSCKEIEKSWNCSSVLYLLPHPDFLT